MDLFWVSNRVPKTRPQFTVPVHVEEASTTEELETSFFSLKKNISWHRSWLRPGSWLRMTNICLPHTHTHTHTTHTHKDTAQHGKLEETSAATMEPNGA